MESHIVLRIANIDDLDLLKYWDTQPHVIACDPNDDWNWEIELNYFPEWREQLVAELDKRPIGFIQIIDPAKEETHYWGLEMKDNFRAIDIWIGENHDLRKGYGTQMMHLAIERCFDTPQVTAILIDPLATNKAAIRFYERIGFRFLESRKMGDNECHIMKLEKKAYLNHEYLY